MLQSAISCGEVKIQHTRFDESDGPVAKIVKGWKKMFLCWCQQKFAVRGERQRKMHLPIQSLRDRKRKKRREKKTSATVWESLLRSNRKLWLTFTHMDCQTRFFPSSTRAYTVNEMLIWKYTVVEAHFCGISFQLLGLCRRECVEIQFTATHKPGNVAENKKWDRKTDDK